MIDEELKESLLKRLKGFDCKSLIDYMEKTKVNYYKASLRGPIGMASINNIYIDVDNINNDRLLYFVILHETAHNKRIKKLGIDKFINSISTEVFDDLYRFLLNEEIICDRYGSFLFYIFNKQTYPKSMTQNLTFDLNKDRFKDVARMILGNIKNTEESFENYTKSFIRNKIK
jgi:hypothetical protein